MKKREIPVMTSRLEPGELAAVLCWLPVHVFGLPWLLTRLPAESAMSDAALNLAIYVLGTLFMLTAARRFLRRDFDPLCDHPGRVLVEICVCYGAMLLFNLAVVGLLSLAAEGELTNPNNAAVVDIAGAEYGKTAAMAVFLAPIVEEMMFRAGIFGLLRRRNRPLAFLVSMLAFSVYHVWGYARTDPSLWIYCVQYLPVAYLLCRCYERTDSIWGSIFFHMLVNAVSLRALLLLEELL